MCYTYDSLNRVIKRQVISLDCDCVVSEENYNYDAAGNITCSPDSCFQYDTNNRLVTYNGNAVRYDLDGNMLRRQENRPPCLQRTIPFSPLSRPSPCLVKN